MSRRPGPAAQVLIALVVGLTLGIVAAAGGAGAAGVIAWIEPIGTLWINAIRMTVIPLVVASIIAAVLAAPDARAVGRVGARSIIVFLAILLGAATFTVLAGPALLAGLTIDPAAAAALREAGAAAGAEAAAGAREIPSFRDWLLALVPTNPVKAASDGELLPLIVFSIAFGLAVTRVAEPRRSAVAAAVAGTAEAMLILVRWILAVAPIGVFALAVALGARLGVTAAGAVLYYMAAVSALCVGFIALLYLVAVALGRVGPGAFARAAAPSQAVAFSARSSLAALPAMIEGAEERLGTPPGLGRFFLPLAASTFRAGGAIGIPFGVLLIARLYGIELGGAELATIALTSVATTFSVPGIPGGSIIVMVPVLLAVGLPPEGIGLLLGVDTIPDMFRTTTNVTGDMAALTVVARWDGTPAAPPVDGITSPTAAAGR